MRTLDLFCGCGGLSSGLALAGLDVVVGVDCWEQALEVYRLNHAHPALKIDIADTDAVVSAVASYRPQVVTGGPPCQEFSAAGKREEAEKADLTRSFATVVEKLRPRFFVMENVDRAPSSEAFAAACVVFRRAGYGLSLHVLDASFCGVPQKRKRMFLVGGRAEGDDFLQDIVASRLSAAPMTVKQYLGDECDFEHYYRHPRHYTRRSVYSVHEPAATIRGVNRPVPEGHKPHHGDAADIRTVNCLPTHVRSRIQTFPADFVWKGSKTAQEQMIGNAVPVNLGRFVGEALMAFASQRLTRDNFTRWLIESRGLSPRGAKDVRSHASRLARGGVDFLRDVDSDVLTAEIETAFSSDARSVVTHMKRTARLHREFFCP